MFHVKHPVRWIVGMALATVLLTGVACGRVSKPNGWAGPADAGNDVMLLHTERGSIAAVRVSDSGSATLWTFPGDNDDRKYQGFYATPVVDRQGARPRVLLASYSGHVVSLDLETGAPAAGWPEKVDVGGHIVATPVLAGEVLYVANGRGEVRTVNTASGIVSAPILDAADRIWGAPALAGGVLFIGSLDGKLRAVAPDGAERWSKGVGGAIAGDIAVDGDTVYAGTLESRVVALDAATGDERWHFDGNNWFWARPLVTSETVYASTALGTVYAVNRADGQKRWESSPGSAEVHASPVLVGGMLVIADRDGIVYGLDPANGTKLWQQQQPGERFFADPLVLESAIFYLSQDGTLVRVRPQDQGALSVVYRRG